MAKTEQELEELLAELGPIRDDELVVTENRALLEWTRDSEDRQGNARRSLAMDVVRLVRALRVKPS